MNNIVTIDVGNTKTKLSLYSKDSSTPLGFLSIYTKDVNENAKKISKFCEGNYIILSSVVESTRDYISSIVKVDKVISINDFPKKYAKKLPVDIGSDLLATLYYFSNSDENVFIVLTGTIWVGMLISNNEIRGVNLFPGINYEISQMIGAADGINNFNSQTYNYLGMTTSEAMLDGVINSHLGYLEKIQKDLTNEWDDINFYISSGEYSQIESHLPSEYVYIEEVVSKGLYKLAIDNLG